MSKYNSKKTVVDGQKFDSKKEANRYQELVLLEMCDEHYDNIKFAVEMYMRANRDEIGTIE